MSPSPNDSNDDIVIAIYGPTGSGKSTMIEMLTNEKGLSGPGIEPFTKDIKSYRARRRFEGKDLVFVDTPGFDSDTDMTDSKVMRKLADWLKDEYQSSHLSGILYLQPITDIRLTGPGKACLTGLLPARGDQSSGKVVLVTTMWNPSERGKQERRESDLKNMFWSSLVSISRYSRAEPMNEIVAWSIVEELLKQEGGKRTLSLATSPQDDASVSHRLASYVQRLRGNFFRFK